MRFAVVFVLTATAYGQYDVPTFHGDPQRTGWISNETRLTPDKVASRFGPVWNSPAFDSVTIGGVTYPPHVYASPLYVDRVTIGDGHVPRGVCGHRATGSCMP